MQAVFHTLGDDLNLVVTAVRKVYICFSSIIIGPAIFTLKYFVGSSEGYVFTLAQKLTVLAESLFWFGFIHVRIVLRTVALCLGT